jgi:SAM-dependent methyltransferase
MSLATIRSAAPEIETALRAAIAAYVSQPLPGAQRSEEYNRSRADARMREEGDQTAAGVARRLGAEVPPPARVLEIGAGTGGIIAALGVLGYDACGVEPDAHGVEASRLRAHRYPEAKIKAVQGYAERIPFPGSTFEAVVSNQVLEHLPDLDEAAREFHRVLTPGGVCIHIMPNYGWPYEPHYRLPYPPRISKDLGRRYLTLLGRDTRLLEEQIFPTTPRRVVDTFQRAGFVNVENRYAREVEAKFDGAHVRTRAIEWTISIARGTGLLPILKRLVLSLELYPSIVLMARKPGGES